MKFVFLSFCLFFIETVFAHNFLDEWVQKERVMPTWWVSSPVRDFYLQLQSQDPRWKNLDLLYQEFSKIEKTKDFHDFNILRSYLYEELLERFQSDLNLVHLIEEKWIKEKQLSPATARWIEKKIQYPGFLKTEKRKTKQLLQLAKSHPIFFRTCYQIINKNLEKKDHRLLYEYGFSSFIEEEKKQKIVTSTSCLDRQKKLEKDLKLEKNSKKQEKFFPIAEKIAVCFGNKKQNFWSQILPFFHKDLQPKIHIKIATIMWNKDLYEESISEIQKAKKGSFLSEALYLEGRIHENHQEQEKAIECYNNVMNLSSERKSDVLKSLILIYAKNQNWVKVAQLSEDLVQWEKKLLADPSFALFWQARGESDKDKKNILLSELMNDFHGTFYGALAHRILEKKSDTKKIPLPTEKNGIFQEEYIKNSLTESERRMFDEIKVLMVSKKHQDAALLIKRIISGNPMVAYVKSLLLYLQKEWLEAIKIYLTLPRDIRNQMPFESEKIVFPIDYESIISEYTKRLSLDSELVFALIRQESVFNPQALSGAQAQGVMQILKSTALEELARIPESSTYLTPNERSFLTTYLKKTKKIFDPKPNIMIGVHHLKTLFGQYHHIALALSAYNAGPVPTAKWVQKYPQKDWLYFIESIPYKETKDYVKVILRNYFYYKKYYNPQDQNFFYLDSIIESMDDQLR